MQRILRFFRNYKLFSLALIAGIIGLALQLTHHRTAANWVIGITSIIEVLPLVWNMWQDIRVGKYGVDILAATAIVVSVILGQYWAGLVVVLMLTGGESLEDYAEHRAKSELDALLSRVPVTATVIRKNKTISIPVDEIHIGDKLVIKAGETVPADAIIIDGAANFDESSLTGESLPVPKELDAQLLSGSINLDGPVTAKATATAADSQYAQIIKLVQSAAASQAPFVRLADRYSIPFTVMAYGIAVAVWVVSGQAIRFLEVVIVATPCPLLLAAPIALISGMARASRYGIIVKTGSALERLADAQAIAFDKTGTLTRGELVVSSVKTLNGFKSEEVLNLAASLEQNSNHVVGQAIITDAQVKKIKITKAKHVQEVAGRGMIAQLKGRQIVVGRAILLEEYDIKVPKNLLAAKDTQSVVYVGVDSKLAGYITFTDEIREESKPTLERLKRLGFKEIIMVTGDNRSTAQAVAKQLDISHVHAEALPAEKLHILAEVKRRPLIFVGDGVNDAPILTASDVGIALGARGSTAASESADMVIMLDDISRVASGIEIAKRTFTIAQQSIIAGIGLSLILMAVFATGKLSPLAGAVAQEVVDVVVIFNALRAHGIKVKALSD